MKSQPKTWALKISTLVVVTACYVLMGGALLVSQNFRNLLTLWGEDVQMTIYLSEDLSSQEKQDLETKIRVSEGVGEVQFVSQDEALNVFRAQMASYAPDLSRDDELLHLIPSSLQVRLKSDIELINQNALLQTLATKFRALDGVDEVSYGQEWVEKYSTVMRAFDLALQFLCIVILAASIFVMSNAIRASVQARREEIVVLEMIGATPRMVRKPFMIEGASLGLVASVLALIMCFIVFQGSKNLLTTQLKFLQLGDQLRFLAPGIFLLFIVLGVGFGALSSYLCVRKINNGFSGRQG